MSQRAVLKSALASGEKGIGYWLTIPGPAVVRALTGIGGFNWVLIDGEHGQINDKDFYELSCAVAAAGASPIVRVPNAEEWMVKRALDCGAHGIMTPMCHSAVSRDNRSGLYSSPYVRGEERGWINRRSRTVC